MSTHAARREARAKLQQAARDNFYVFNRMMFPIINPETEFIDAFHFQVITRALQEVVTGKTPRLLLSVPPRHGKSRLSSVALPAWFLGRDPTATVICASYGSELSVNDFARRTRQVMIDPGYAAIFPECRLSANGHALSELRTTAGGARLATSTSGTVTGKGAQLVIIDDPLKAIDANSDIARRNAYDWFKTSIMSRFDRPSEGRVVVTHQRLHQDDLIGRLASEGGWEHVSLPGICDVIRVFILQKPGVHVWKPGEPLFPEAFDLAAHQQLRLDLGEAGYNAQILQRPVPAGGFLFKLAQFRRYKTRPAFEMVIQSWDPAFTDQDHSAYSVCTTWGIQGCCLYLIDVFRKKMTFSQLRHALLAEREKHNARYVILECAGNLGMEFANSFLNLPNAREWIIPETPKVGKTERAIAQTPLIERGRVFLPERAIFLEAFEHEVAEFPMSKYKDQVDSMVQFLAVVGCFNRMTMNLSVYRDGASRFP